MMGFSFNFKIIKGFLSEINFALFSLWFAFLKNLTEDFSEFIVRYDNKKVSN